MSLYFSLLLISVFIPLILSFDKRLQFYRQWIYFLPAILVIALVYIFFDIRFTKDGIWGFNPEYLSGIMLAGLPLEECLFFIIIPYASVFLHESFFEYFPDVKPSSRLTACLSVILLLMFGVLALLHADKAYTLFASLSMILVLIWSFFDPYKELSRFFVSFLLITIPFLIVNGVLTGSFIEGEVVWYNPGENLGIRIFTIPVEDFAYGFSLILSGILLRNRLRYHFIKGGRHA
jgi:lycopene cyclase domain-containing protein